MVQVKTNGLTRPDLDNLLEGCQIIGFDWRYVYLNKTAEFHNHVPNDELIGEKYQNKWPGIEKTEVYRLIKDCLENRNAHRFENEFIYPNQTIGWFDLSIQPVPEGVFILSIDITKPKLTEEALRKSETKFRKIYEEGPFGMALVNSEFRFINANNTYCKITGYSEQELQSRTFKDISYKNDEKESIAIRRLIKGEITVYNNEKQYVRKDGIVIWGSLTVTANFNHDGKFLYNLAILEDISARKQAEQALIENKAYLDSTLVKIRELNETLEQRVEERTTQLRAANKELEAFSYSVSHDLRAPLRSINGFTQILMDEYKTSLDSEGKRICKVIQENSQRMGRLIDELLAFSQLSRSEMMFTKIKMKELIKAVYEELNESGDNNEIEFNLGVIPDSQGDPNMIKQVWTNLLQNAIKYSSKNEHIKISISSREANGFFVYCIKDNGVGFDMEFKDKLFGVFQRLHSNSEFEGTGVGLAIVQRIISRHGGKVWAKGETGKGAEFYFSLPEKQKD